MCGHEAVSDEGHSVERDVFPQQLQVNLSISITVEDEAPRISTLRDMMWNIQGDYSVESSHDRDDNTSRTARMTPLQIKKPSCFLKLYQNKSQESLETKFYSRLATKLGNKTLRSGGHSVQHPVRGPSA